MRKPNAQSLEVQQRSPSDMQTIRRIASQARAFYLKDQSRDVKSSAPTATFNPLDKTRAYEYAKRAAQQLGIDDEDLIQSASALVHLDPKEWDARFPKPKPQRNVSNVPSPFEQELEKTRREASPIQGLLHSPNPKPRLFQGTALENAPGVKDVTNIPRETDLATAAAYWGLRSFLRSRYGHHDLAVGWGDRINEMSESEFNDQLRPFISSAAIAIGNRELDDREMQASMNLIRLMARHREKDWDTLVGNGEPWRKRVADATRRAKESKKTNNARGGR